MEGSTNVTPPSGVGSGPSLPQTGHAWWAYSIYIVFGLGIALLLVTAYVILTAPGLFRVDLPGALLGIAAFLIGLSLLDRLPRNIKVGPEGVEFEYFLSHIDLRWDQLDAPTSAGKGFVAFRAVTGARGVWGSLAVTYRQAREILSYPACPHFALPDDVARELGYE